MDQYKTLTGLAMVAAATVAAAHRRDHRHDLGGQPCRPHDVEVIQLGQRAVAVCHDCAVDTGYLSGRAADVVAASHRQQTLVKDALLGPSTAA